MKILLVGYHNPNFIALPEYIEKAVKDIGHECIFFDNRKFIIPGRIRDKIPCLHNWDINRINRNLVSVAARQRPDICLSIGGYRILPETIDRMNLIGVKTVLWTTDPPRDFQETENGCYQPVKGEPKYFQLIVERASHYGHIVCSGTEAMAILKRAGISKTELLPFACVPEIHKSMELTSEEQKKYGHDIVFVGSNYPNRQEILNKLVDFDLGIYGPGWERLQNNSFLQKYVKGGQLQPDEWIKIYSAATMAIVIHYQNGRTPCYQASPKLYEAMACGKFVLVDSQRDAKASFEDKKHVVFFSGIQDLRENFFYYMKHPDEREKIARVGKEEVLNKHSYQHRIKQLLEIINSSKI